MLRRLSPLFRTVSKCQFSSKGQRVVISEFGNDPIDALENHYRVEEFESPDPATLGPDDVLIKIKACAVSWVDMLMTSGQYQHQPKPPYTPGLEYSGIIVNSGDVAKEEYGMESGKEVFVDCITTGPRTSGKYRQNGGMASYTIAPAWSCHAKPANFSFEEAANFLGNYETAYHVVVHCAEAKAGETILIHGATGGTGLAAVQIAKILGLNIIATGGSDDKLEIVKANGADHVINIRDDNADNKLGITKFRDQVRALTTNGKGVDIVYDAVGGPTSIETLRCVNFGARFCIVGWTSTPFVAKGKGQRGAPNANMLPTNLMMMKGLKVMGCPMIIHTQHDPSIRQPRLNAIQKWASEGLIKPHVSHTFPLAQAKEALLARWNRKVTGGCAVIPPSE